MRHSPGTLPKSHDRCFSFSDEDFFFFTSSFTAQNINLKETKARWKKNSERSSYNDFLFMLSQVITWNISTPFYFCSHSNTNFIRQIHVSLPFYSFEAFSFYSIRVGCYWKSPSGVRRGEKIIFFLVRP